MGNRAVLTFDQNHNSPAIYLHWNGGRASVDGFLAAARLLGLRHCDPGQETQVMDKLATMIGRSFFGNDVGFTVYRGAYGKTDKCNGDNGVYLLNRDMTIGGRLFSCVQEERNTEKERGITEQIIQRAPAFND